MNYEFLYYVSETDDWGYGMETLWHGFNSYTEALNFYNSIMERPSHGKLQLIDSIKEIQSKINKLQLQLTDMNDNIKRLKEIEG